METNCSKNTIIQTILIVTLHEQKPITKQLKTGNEKNDRNRYICTYVLIILFLRFCNFSHIYQYIISHFSHTEGFLNISMIVNALLNIYIFTQTCNASGTTGNIAVYTGTHSSVLGFIIDTSGGIICNRTLTIISAFLSQ